MGTWRDCGNAVYEDYRQPMEKVRHHFHCSQLHLSCDDCPVYKEKRTKHEQKRSGKSGRSPRL